MEGGDTNVVNRCINVIRTNSSADKAFGFDMIAKKCSEAYEVYFMGEMLCQSSRCASFCTLQDGEFDTHPQAKAGDTIMTYSALPASIREIVSGEQGIADFTDLRNEEDALREFRTNMAHMEWLASLGTRSAALAHEMKQPLTVVHLSLDDALDELKAASSHLESAMEELKEALTQIPNLTSIFNGFCNLPRYTSDNPVTEVDVRTVAERVAKLFSRNQRQMRIVLNIEEAIPLPPVRMIERDLEQLFFALVENALYAANGRGTRQLIINCQAKGRYVELRFSDNCGGIPEENLDKIFEPFFTTRPRGQGTGLGLCMVQEIVARAGGSVRAESELGKGSTFIVSLPLSPSRSCADRQRQVTREKAYV